MTQDIRGRPPMELAQTGGAASSVVSVALVTQATPWYGLSTSASYFLGSPLCHFFVPLGDPQFPGTDPFFGTAENVNSLADVRIVCSVKIPPPARTYLYLEYASTIDVTGSTVNFTSAGLAAKTRVPGSNNFATTYFGPGSPATVPYVGVSKSGTNASPWFRLTEACRAGFTINTNDPNTPTIGDRFFRVMGRCESGTPVTTPMFGATYIQFRPSQGEGLGATPF